MNKSPGTIESLIQAITEFTEPLSSSLDPDGFLAFVQYEMNTSLPSEGFADPALVNNFNKCKGELESIVGTIGELRDAIAAEDIAKIIIKSTEAIGKVKTIIQTVKDLSAQIPSISSSFPPDIAKQFEDYAENILERIIDTLITLYADRHLMHVETFDLLGLFEIKEITLGDAPNDKKVSLGKINLNKIPDFVQSPIKHLKEIYRWGENDFKGELLLGRLVAGMNRNNIDAFFHPASGSTPAFIEHIFFNIHHHTDGAIPGLAIEMKLPIPDGFAIEQTISDRWNIVAEVKGSFKENLTLLISPPGDFSVLTSNDASAGISISSTNKQSDGERLMIFGLANIITVTTAKITSSLSLDYTSKGSAATDKITAEMGFALSGGEFELSVSEDGFLSKIIGAGSYKQPFDLILNYSIKNGLTIRGTTGLEIMVPTHVSLGPIDIQNLTIAVKQGDHKTPVSISSTIKANLGPLTIVVEELGMSAEISFPDEGGNLGPLNFGIGFKPPTGVGLSINAGAVSGGGFLRFDPDAEEYSGMLELTIVDIVSAKAIGIITTKMPDGSKGFSLLIIITAEFSPPYQLGYGFTLNGVGGLLGLNRTVLVDVLREGVRTGAVNSIMFPQNIIANAPRIISDLKSVFPPYEGKFLIGPMAKLGWGTPTLITLSFGLIIEIPGNIAILGVLRIVLPDKDKVLVNVNVNFVGILDFNKKLLSFDASLFESRILTMTLEGDMAVRLKWGDEPDFILTVGGFHPQYIPPPLALPALKRISVSVLNSENAKLRFEFYEAVTSNTVQFGSKAEMYFGYSAFSVDGHISFDALFQFSPFMFIINISGQVGFKAFGVGVFSINLKFSLQGPTPWRAKGRGGISFFFFSVSADFDKTWGETQDTSLPPIEIRQRLLDELKKPEQWQASLDFGKKLFVTLRKLDASETALLMHPSGALIVSQKLMPLDLDIDKIGNQKISDIKNISITHAESAGAELHHTPATESFAIAQYKDMTDAEKLSRASFEKLNGGVSLTMGNEILDAGMMTRRIVKYEEIIIDKEPQKPSTKGQPGGLFNAFLRGNAATKSVLSKSTKKKLQPFEGKIAVNAGTYTVAFTDNNNAVDTSATFSSEAMAIDYMGKLVSGDSALKNKLHVIDEHEVNHN